MHYQPKTATLMPTAPTPKDHSHVHATKDIPGMEHYVKVSIIPLNSSLWRFNVSYIDSFSFAFSSQILMSVPYQQKTAM